MKTIQKEFFPSVSYPLNRIGNPETTVFFDIETTGFSRTHDHIYLIGCVWQDKTSWQMIQWFAEDATDEARLLCSFFHFLKNFQFLVHFNGDRFDIPFILNRCSEHGLDFCFDALKSVDIYRLIRPFRRLLGLESLKQKSIENFLGLERTDQYSGGELTEVYRKYLLTKNSLLEHLLLLHNEDDLKGMPDILPILCYPDFFRSSFSFCGQKLREITDYSGKKEKELILTYKNPVCLPARTEFSAGIFLLALNENHLTLSVPLFEGELKHYYEDYQNYYYLIYEDCAVHKSVAQYVDKSARKKATAGTCYTRVNGLFLPQPAPIWKECLKTDCRGKTSYTPYGETLFENNKTAVQYLEAVLSSVIDCSR